MKRVEIPVLATRALALAVSIALSGCLATAPPAPDVPKATGAAAGGAAVGADAMLQTCPEPVGTVRLQDSMQAAAGRQMPDASPGGNNMLAMLMTLQTMSGQNNAGRNTAQGNGSNVSLDSLRLLIQQSNCFLIVDRGLDESAANEEKGRSRTSGEVRDGVNMGQGQEVAADFVLRSSVVRLETGDSTSIGGGGFGGKFLGGLSSSSSKTEAQVQLIVSDLRSKIQIAVAQGQGSGKNTALASKMLGFNKILGGASISSQSKTSSTTVLLQAFADAYNKLVPALVNYKTQMVKGGLGNGGTLRVQGARTEPAAVANQP